MAAMDRVTEAETVAMALVTGLEMAHRTGPAVARARAHMPCCFWPATATETAAPVPTAATVPAMEAATVESVRVTGQATDRDQTVAPATAVRETMGALVPAMEAATVESARATGPATDPVDLRDQTFAWKGGAVRLPRVCLQNSDFQYLEWGLSTCSFVYLTVFKGVWT